MPDGAVVMVLKMEEKELFAGDRSSLAAIESFKCFVRYRGSYFAFFHCNFRNGMDGAAPLFG